MIKFSKLNKKTAGFTLIEILVVIAIVGILASVVTIVALKVREKARIAAGLQFSSTIHNVLGVDLISEWKFDEGSDGVVATEAKDTSENENHGTIGDNPVWQCEKDDTTNGKGCSLEFDGDGDYVIKNPFNDFPTIEITVEFWMNSSDTSKSGTPISYAALGGSDNEFIIYNYKNFMIFVGAASVSTGISGNNGSWHHIVVTWRSSDGNVKLYKDGKIEYSGTLQNGYSIVSDGSFVAGQEQDSVGGGFSSSQAFLGLMDEVRIYDQVLSSAQIRKLYAEGVMKKGLAVK